MKNDMTRRSNNVLRYFLEKMFKTSFSDHQQLHPLQHPFDLLLANQGKDAYYFTTQI